VCHSFFVSAQTLLDAGADVNATSSEGGVWPLAAAAAIYSDVGMAWLLEHGASLTLTNYLGRTIAHVLARAEPAGSASSVARFQEFVSTWLRRIIAAEPSLLETRDTAAHSPLMASAGMGAVSCVATLLELGADIAATNAAGDTALSLACTGPSLSVV